MYISKGINIILGQQTIWIYSAASPSIYIFLLILLKLYIRGLNSKPAAVNRMALNIFTLSFISFLYLRYKSKRALKSAKCRVYYIIKSFLIWSVK